MRLSQKAKGGPWYVDLRSLGAGRVCTDCHDKGAARLRAVVLEREAADPDRAAADRAAAYRVTDALQHLLDTTASRSRHYEYRCGHLERLLGSVRLADLGLEHVTKYLRTRHSEGAADSTIEKERKALGRALLLARKGKRWTGVPDDVMPDDWHPKLVKRTRWLTPEELPLLLAQLEPHRQRWVLLAVYLGARAHGVEALTWADVDLRAGVAHLRETKTAGADRVVPVPASLAALLHGWYAGVSTGPLAAPWDHDDRDLKAACRRAGIPPATPNDLRRTYASWLTAGGATLGQVAKLLGHASEDMARTVYVQHDPLQLGEAAAQLPGVVVPETVTLAERRRTGTALGVAARCQMGAADASDKVTPRPLASADGE